MSTKIPNWQAEWHTTAERGFGGLWDALGLKPLRQMQQAALALAAAQADELAAQGQLAQVTSGAWVESLQAMAQRLEARQSGADAVASPTDMLRLWLAEMDAAMHSAMLSEPGLKATAASVRATSKRRAGQQRLVALSSEALDLPTRAEVDAAFQEIQQLKREVRQLKQAMRDAGIATRSRP